MEKDDEFTGVTGSHLNFGARIYDSRVGRFLSIDPLIRDYPMLTPYQLARNNPILRLDPTGMWDVTVHVYNDREKHGYGVAIVTDRSGNEVYRFDIRAEGTGGHNRSNTNADTPLGVYDIPENGTWLSSTNSNRASYGPNDRLVMTGESGEITETDRQYIRIHGGRQETYNAETGEWTAVDNPQLERTYGCLRAYDTDMEEFKDITDDLEANDDLETPGQVEVVDDLEEVNTPASPGNFVEVNTEYRVPVSEDEEFENAMTPSYMVTE
jgi:RHS repeat-associated protein